MEVIHAKDDFKLIKHDRSCFSYCDSKGGIFKYQLKNILFNNFKRKEKIQNHPDNIKSTRMKQFLRDCKLRNLFNNYSDNDIDRLKSENLELMEKFYKTQYNVDNLRGENSMNEGQISVVNGSSFLFPPKCKFFNNNVFEINQLLTETDKFDFIVIDPPWKCRYIKRLKKTFDKKSYRMITNEELTKIPLSNYTHESTIVIIWCTNSETHENFIKDSLLKQWNLKLNTIWHWIKIDKTGDTFCCHGNKKPYEKIFIATHNKNKKQEDLIERDISLVSHPSSIHSHKPPLLNLFRHLLPAKPKCLELFARSLYENFTSIGMEVLKLQNIMLYEKTFIDSPDQNFLCDELVQQQMQNDSNDLGFDADV